MNKIYNIPDTLNLCEIFEQRSILLEKLFKFNPEFFLKNKQDERVLFETVDGEVKRFSSKIIKMD